MEPSLPRITVQMPVYARLPVCVGKRGVLGQADATLSSPEDQSRQGRSLGYPTSVLCEASLGVYQMGLADPKKT